MAAKDRRFNDGNKPAGSVLVVLPDGTECVAENFNTEEGSSWDDVQDELGQPDGGIGTADLKTGTTVLQLPNQYIDIPQVLTPFIAPFRGQNKLFVFSKIGQPRTQKGIRKFNFDFREVVHPEAYTAPVNV